MKFSIGYTEDGDFLSLIEKYKNNISSIYFSLPSDKGSSGRSLNNSKDYEINIRALIEYCKNNGIGTILALNSNCEGQKTGEKEQLNFLILQIGEYHNLGVNNITLQNLLYVPFIKKEYPGLKIYNSVNCGLNTLEQAIYFKKIGVDVLTINRDINRNLKLIGEIKNKTGLEIQIMLNEGCIKYCPYRRPHFNLGAHSESEEEETLFDNFSCTYLFKKNKKYFFRIPFVRPEDLHYYSNYVDYFKLTTRGLSVIVIDRILNAYISESHEGNLLDILDMYLDKFMRNTIGYIDNKKLSENDFFEKIKNCPGDCASCNVCDSFLI